MSPLLLRGGDMLNEPLRRSTIGTRHPLQPVEAVDCCVPLTLEERDVLLQSLDLGLEQQVGLDQLAAGVEPEAESLDHPRSFLAISMGRTTVKISRQVTITKK
jgi:hypothetical protein